MEFVVCQVCCGGMMFCGGYEWNFCGVCGYYGVSCFCCRVYDWWGDGWCYCCGRYVGLQVQVGFFLYYCFYYQICYGVSFCMRIELYRFIEFI